ncbi:hypothetical protein CXB51_002567 [Gossypium anomalum]|uniref:Integrase catalytic domain-containing protein n=1 Tax=Gossypium anomalum TaxID=47600 RepID=A0A8J5ZM41_9ROSI|nr:hypothetical protein CXB51_002567 [Gossypium anomalum]
MVETQTGRKVKRLRSDNDTEYKNDLFLQVCQDKGILQHFTIRDTPQQNGVAERMNRTILEQVRCMLSNAGLGNKFWAEAVTYACHLINSLPSAAINGKTLMEMWTGKSATDYDSLHLFGSTAYYHVKESKLDPRAKKSLFLGITGGVKGYRLWCPDTRKIFFSRDVIFDESTMLKYKDSQKDDKTNSTLQQVELEKVNDDPTNIGGTNYEEVPTKEPLQQQDSIAYRRPRREIRKPAHFDDIVAYAFLIADDVIPSTYTEAISNPDGGKKAIGRKWVYAKKEGFPSKNEIRYKARLVVNGYAQKEGIDYNEVFSPVVKHSSIQILLALVAQYDLELVQLDVKTAFLHSDLEEEIYITQPDGFKIKPVSIPLTSHFKLFAQLSPSTNTEREYMLQVPYSNAVGSLMYVMKTVDFGLLFKQDNTLGKCVIGYVDSDYASDLDKQRSTTGYVFTLAGGPISWKSTLQCTVALSTTEAEYMAVT